MMFPQQPIAGYSRSRIVQGPTNTATNWFSELHNNSTIDASGNASGTRVLTNPVMAFSSFTAAGLSVASNQYFQYLVAMESDDVNSLCSAAVCVPEITSIMETATPNPPITASVGRAFSGGLTQFNLTVSGTCTSSTVKVQVSTDDGANYTYWNGSTWAASNGTIAQASTLALAQSNITDALLASSGTFRFRAFVAGTTSETCELSNPNIRYNP